jgi:dihydrofolate reductase
MRKVMVQEFLALDGTAQAPGGAEEDTSGGFKHGGWQMQYLEDAGMNWVRKGIQDAGGFLLGRRTYEIFAGYWPSDPGAPPDLAESLNTKAKHVASRTLTGELEWQNSRVLEGNLAESVAALKEEDGGDLLVIGSTELVQSLLEHGLVDGFRLVIDPLLVGGGKRVFPDDGELRPLQLVEHEVTSTGAIIATYALAES